MKQNYAIIADVTCDLSVDLQKRFGVDGVLEGTIITPNNTEVKAKLDLSDNEIDDFYKDLKSNKNGYKTTAMSADAIVAYFEEFLKKGLDILALSLSSSLSVTYNLMLHAQKELTKRYPKRQVLIVDSKKYSIGLGLLTVCACQYRDQGLDLTQNFQKLENIKMNIHQMGPIDDLFWVASKGRISHAKAFFGTILGIKPMGDFDANGMVSVLTKMSGYDKAYKVTIEYIKQIITNPSEQIVFVAHSARRQQAQLLAKLIEENIKPKEVIITNIYPANGINIGPGLVAAYFLGTTITDLEHEKSVINNIVVTK